MIPLELADLGEVKTRRRDEDIDLNATPVYFPAGKAAVQKAMRFPWFSGWLEVIATVRFYDRFFYILGVKFLPSSYSF